MPLRCLAVRYISGKYVVAPPALPISLRSKVASFWSPVSVTLRMTADVDQTSRSVLRQAVHAVPTPLYHHIIQLLAVEYHWEEVNLTLRLCLALLHISTVNSIQQDMHLMVQNPE